MRYILDPWQSHAAREGDAMILRACRPWDQVGWTVSVYASGKWSDAGLGDHTTVAEAEAAARAALGVQ